MPILENDPDCHLNSFIDVAIRDDRELNPIVNASRIIRRREEASSISSRTSRGRQRNTDTKARKSPPPVVPETPQLKPKAPILQRDNQTPWRKERSTPRLGDSLADVSLSSMSLGGKQRVEGPAEKEASEPNLQHNLDTTLSHESESARLARKNLKEQEDSERISVLEHEMAKLKFELAHARAEADFHKLQHRHLHVEFEDLQAFCKQLQEENRELRTNGVVAQPARRKKWFKSESERIRKLSTPRQMLQFSDSMRQLKTNSAMEEELNSAFNSDESDEYWDDDTLTTNFGGTHRPGEDESTLGENSKKGPLMSLIDRTKSTTSALTKAMDSKLSAKPDTPRDITVDVKYPDDGALDLDEDNTTETNLLVGFEEGSRQRRLRQGDYDSISLGPKMNGFMRKLKGFNAMRKGLGGGDEDQSCLTGASLQTTRTMPEIGHTLSGRRSSSIQKHRYVPNRTMSNDRNSSFEGYLVSNNELDELDLDLSDHSYEPRLRDNESDVFATALERSEIPEQQTNIWWETDEVQKPAASSLNDTTGRSFQHHDFEEKPDYLSDIDEQENEDKATKLTIFSDNSHLVRLAPGAGLHPLSIGDGVEESFSCDGEDSSSDLSVEMPNDMSVATDPSNRSNVHNNMAGISV